MILLVSTERGQRSLGGKGMIQHEAEQPKSRNIDQEVLEHLDALYGYAMSLVRNPTEAEDLVQEACLRALKSARRYPPTGDLKAWLFTILRNLWINHQKRRHRGPEFISLSAQSDEQDPLLDGMTDHRLRPDRLLDRSVLQANIRAAIESLPAIFREIILLRYVEGFSYNQIAGILGCPAGTVMSRLNRARAALRQRLLVIDRGP
ncbi:MAG: sigma-70 family RNA polymerase sigma factor [Acidobacteria bacterium]|nr:MAG: sigma-70 family RNA polymerase sigma factor [Acidobacteriota bacterium]